MELITEAVNAGARKGRVCKLLGLSIRTLQRWLDEGVGADKRAGPHSEPPSKLTLEERQKVIDLACSPRFRNKSPKQIVPLLLDEGVHVASVSTFYRILQEEGLLKHRGKARAPRKAAARPESKTATGPCQLWSWDITYVPGPIRGTFFYLYLIVDIWSRKAVGHAVHSCESAEHAAALIRETCAREGIASGQVILHSDNGGPMKGATMLATLQGLGVAASFSRPRVSDDNPYSEALFRTAKYGLHTPNAAFASLEAAAEWADTFVRWYNHEHLHSGVEFVTPADRHAGLHIEILDNRQRVLEAARAANPSRWSGPCATFTPTQEVELHPQNPAAA